MLTVAPAALVGLVTVCFSLKLFRQVRPSPDPVDLFEWEEHPRVSSTPSTFREAENIRREKLGLQLCLFSVSSLDVQKKIKAQKVLE